MTYAKDFPETWLGCSLVIGTSSRVPIKKGAVETIGAATASGKAMDVKLEKMKTIDVEESTKGVKIGPDTKRRKTGKSQTHLVSYEGKDVGQPLASRTRKKIKVESSFSQVPVTTSVHGSLGSSDFASQPPLGLSGRTRSKQKTSRESIEREKGKTSFLLLSFSLVHIIVIISSLLTSDGFFCSPNASLITRRAKANLLVTTWYVCPLYFFFPSLLF